MIGIREETREVSTLWIGTILLFLNTLDVLLVRYFYTLKFATARDSLQYPTVWCHILKYMIHHTCIHVANKYRVLEWSNILCIKVLPSYKKVLNRTDSLREPLHIFELPLSLKIS